MEHFSALGTFVAKEIQTKQSVMIDRLRES